MRRTKNVFTFNRFLYCMNLSANVPPCCWSRKPVNQLIKMCLLFAPNFHSSAWREKLFASIPIAAIIASSDSLFLAHPMHSYAVRSFPTFHLFSRLSLTFPTRIHTVRITQSAIPFGSFGFDRSRRPLLLIYADQQNKTCSICAAYSRSISNISTLLYERHMVITENSVEIRTMKCVLVMVMPA